MLKKGFLAANVIYPSIAHEDELVIRYLEALNDVFYEISNKSEEELISSIEGPLCHAGFKRIN